MAQQSPTFSLRKINLCLNRNWISAFEVSHSVALGFLFHLLYFVLLAQMEPTCFLQAEFILSDSSVSPTMTVFPKKTALVQLLVRYQCKPSCYLIQSKSKAAARLLSTWDIEYLLWLRGGEKHPKSPASTFLSQSTEACGIQRGDVPLPHKHPQGFGEVHSCIKGYHHVQARLGGGRRSISCTGSVCVRAGGGGGRCASYTGPASAVPHGWCCCHQVDQQRRSQTHTRTATFISQPSWEGSLPSPPLHNVCYSIYHRWHSTVSPKEKKKYWCWLASGINCYISSHSLLPLKVLLNVFPANF